MDIIAACINLRNLGTVQEVRIVTEGGAVVSSVGEV